jgi:hypothetical protein
MRDCPAVYTVLSLGDASVPAPGVVNGGTFRWCVDQVNNNPDANGDTIQFSVPLGSITFGSQITINKPVSIIGSVLPVISPNPIPIPPILLPITTFAGNPNGGGGRFLTIASGIEVNISNLAFTLGDVPGLNENGGAILNHGNLTLTNCFFSDNRANGGYGGPFSQTVNSP